MRGLGTGELKHPRFTKEEAAASEGTKHERLWSYILSLESSDVHAGGTEALGRSEGGTHSQDGDRLGLLRRMATRYGSDPQEIAAGEHKYLDRGAESSVYDAGDGTVVKVRKLQAYNLDGVKEALAKIVYHNYLFPKDAYTLQDIAVWDNNGYDLYYLVLEQPLVTPKTDAEGYIIAPSEGQIFEALNKTKQRFRIWDEAWSHQGTDEVDDFDSADSSDMSSADFVPSARKIAYNDQFMVYDFKPGRNTFIDAETGEVRFIDPRVDINDPGAGFSVSRFGKRKIDNRPMSFEGSPFGDMEGLRFIRFSRGGSEKKKGAALSEKENVARTWLKNKDLLLTEEGEVYNGSTNNSASRSPSKGDNAEGNSPKDADSVSQTDGEGKGGIMLSRGGGASA